MRLIKGLPVMIIASLAIFSCDNEPSSKNATYNDLSEQAKNYFKMSRNNGASQDGLNSSLRAGSPVNLSFQGLYNQSLSASAGRIAGDTIETEPSDSTIYPSDTTIYYEPWVSCAEITTVQNGDGSITTTYDYGTGCEEGYGYYKYWMMGRYSFTYLNNFTQTGSTFKDSYYYKALYDNYGGGYYFDSDSSTWITNGSSDYEGESTYDSAQGTFTGYYAGNYNYDYIWNNQTYTYVGIGKYLYTQEKYIVEKNNYSYTNGSDYYKTDVLEPLVMRYDCHQNSGGGELENGIFIWTYMSGKEFIRYKQGDTEGSFEIYYGDGECDNIIVIIENGKRVEIDLGDQNFAW